MRIKTRKERPVRPAWTPFLLAALAASGGPACILAVDSRSATMAKAAADADDGRLCEAAQTVVKEEAAAAEARRSVQSTPAYARVRSAWRQAIDSLHGQCRLRFAVHPKMPSPWSEMHVYAELDLDPVAQISVPIGVETPVIVDRTVAAGAHVAYVEVVAIAATPPYARMTTRGWTRLPCPETSADITFDLGDPPGMLHVTSVPPRPWAELRVATPCNSIDPIETRDRSWSTD
jgi:hypothetical protein